MITLPDITPDLSTYRLDEELLQQVLQSKVDKLASKQAFETSATLTRILAKEGITESEGDSAELHTGMCLLCLNGICPFALKHKLFFQRRDEELHSI